MGYKELVYQYWKKKDTIKLEVPKESISLNAENYKLLFEIGLPVLGDLRKPISKVEKIEINNQEYIKLIRRLPLEITKREDDALILLKISNNQIFYLNNFFFHCKIIDTPFSYMNKDLFTMYYFYMIFDVFEESTTLEKLKYLTVSDAKKLHNELLQKMNFADYHAIHGLDLNPNKATYWRRLLSNLEFDLQEFYNESF